VTGQKAKLGCTYHYFFHDPVLPLDDNSLPRLIRLVEKNRYCPKKPFDDIPLLVWHFIGRKNARLGKTIDDVPQALMNALVEYDWPGNVRELENVIERAMILSTDSALVLNEVLGSSVGADSFQTCSSSLAYVDRAHIIGVLEQCNWTVKGPGQAAERLGLAPSTLQYRMKKLGIQRPTRHTR
jgi:transcriptional regulator with GAF, ATPase, and Fis domain